MSLQDTLNISNISPETRTRVITGAIGGAAMLLLILLGGYIGITLIAAVLAWFMTGEMADQFFEMSDRNEKTLALRGAAWLIIFVNMILPRTMLESTVIIFMGLFSYFLVTAERHPENLRRHFDELVFTTFSLVYIVVFIAFLPLIRDGANGSRWIIHFFLIVWAGDTGAYFAGKKWGSRRLYPLISPKKSVEGSLGGLVSSVVISILFKLIFFKSMGWLGAFMIPIAVGIVSQMGDLCESFFKRAYHIKDSGKILPGHGGMLDRFDGVLFSLPVMYLCVKVFS